MREAIDMLKRLTFEVGLCHEAAELREEIEAVIKRCEIEQNYQRLIALRDAGRKICRYFMDASQADQTWLAIPAPLRTAIDAYGKLHDALMYGGAASPDRRPGPPFGVIQWNGTTACINFHCVCGFHGHLDEEYIYFYRCKCGRLYKLLDDILLRELTGKEKAKVESESSHVIHDSDASAHDRDFDAFEVARWKRFVWALSTATGQSEGTDFRDAWPVSDSERQEIIEAIDAIDREKSKL